MKNKYRSLVPICLVVLMAVSIYSMVSAASSKEKEIDELLNKASSCAQQGLYDKSASYYSSIIEKDNRIDYYLNVIDMYYDAEQYEACSKWCEKALTSFPKDARSYDRMIRVCLQQKAYSDAYTTLDDFDGRRLTSETIEKYRSDMEYLFYVDTLSYDDVTSYSSEYVGFNNKGKWGLATVKGSSKVKAQFKQIGYFANGLVAVLDDSNTWYYMDENGEYAYNISNSVGGEITDVGLYNNDLFPVCKDGKYGFYDISFTKKLGDYDFAGSFSGGIAAVKQGDQWHIINTQGEDVTKETYESVVLDGRGVCCQNDRLFVKSQDDYIMINSAGERVGTESFDDAKLFSNGEYAAVMQGELWGFLNHDGAITLEPRYENALSFSMGLAAVCENELWGYIDTTGNTIVDLEYKECRSFASTGTAYVKSDTNWALIKLYKYNH